MSHTKNKYYKINNSIKEVILQNNHWLKISDMKRSNAQVKIGNAMELVLPSQKNKPSLNREKPRFPVF